MRNEFEEIIEYSKENKKIFDELLALCINGLIVPYIGAGMSAFRFPLWSQYLKDLCSQIGYDLTISNNIDAAEIIENKIGKFEFHQHIKQTFGGNIDNKEWETILINAQNQAISLIPKLFHSPIITTNFDQIIEKLHEDRVVVFPSNIERLERIVSYREPIIYKIHGCVSDIENIVFTKSQYNKVYACDTSLVKSLNSFFTIFHILFLGCSLAINDSEKSTKEKYIELWEKLQYKGMYHFAIVDCIDNEHFKLQRRKELSENNIHAILYKSGKHQSVKIILDELLNRISNILFRIPSYTSKFVDTNDSTINNISTIYKNDCISILAITGLGGVGKTRIMSEYARVINTTTNIKVFWINAISRNYVRIQIQEFLKMYHIISSTDKDDIIIQKAFKGWMRENNNYIFLLDNVEEVDYIEEYFDVKSLEYKKSQFVLMTTRLSENKLNGIRTIPIKGFNHNDALTFLEQNTGQVRNQYAEYIISLLGCLPLALEQAASYIKSGETYQKYAELLQEKPILKILDTYHPNSGIASVSATWNITLERIKCQASKDFLKLCAFLAPDSINLNWFIKAKDSLLSSIRNAISTDTNDIIAPLIDFSLINISNNMINIHRLLQSVIINSIRDKSINYIKCCVNFLNDLCEWNFTEKTAIDCFVELSPHIISVIKHIKRNERIDNIDKLYYYLGKGFYELGSFKDSIIWHNTLLEYRKCHNTLKDVAESYNEIGIAFDALDDQENALKNCLKSLNIFREICGDNSMEVSTLYNNIAGFYRGSGDQEFALHYYEKSMNIKINLFGENDIRTANAYNNIAGSYIKLDRLEDAQKYYHKALEIRENHCRNHADKLMESNIATTYNDISWIYLKKRLYEDAIIYCNKSLTIWRDFYGERHPYVASAYHTLGEIYKSWGKYNEAMQVYIQSYYIRTIIFGTLHKKTETVYNEIKKIYPNLGISLPLNEWLNSQIDIL